MKTILSAMMMLAATAASADQCPKLAGTFECPALNGNPAFVMRVTQLGSVRKTVSYSWQYSAAFPPAGYFASVKGVKNPDGYYGLCRNQGLYVTRSLEDVSAAYRNEVNPKGNYVITTFMGEPVMTCLRALKRRIR